MIAGLSIKGYAKLEFLLQHVFIDDLDKANNNACLICIYHLWVQALHRLQEKDFPSISMTITDTLLLVEEQLMELVPEVQFWDVGLPYFMATYKLHKKKYRWLTNAANCVFLAPTTIITQALHLVINELKEWCGICNVTYKRFGKVTTNTYYGNQLFL